MLQVGTVFGASMTALLISLFQGVSQTTVSTYPIAAQGAVGISTVSGDIKVSSWDGSTVKVTAEKTAQTQAVLDQLKVDAVANNGNVAVKAVYPPSCTNCGVSFDVQVPRGVSVTAHTESGNVRVMEISGTADVHSASGNLVVTNVGGMVNADTSSGNIRVQSPGAAVHCRTSSGNIDITGARGDLDALTANGNVKARLDNISDVHGIMLRTTEGNVELALPRNASAIFDVSTTAGSIRSDFGQVPTQGYAGASLTQTLGDGRIKVKLNTTAGNVSLLTD